MTLATWIAIGVCGPGAAAVFLWFLAELLRRRRRPPDPGPDGCGDDGE